MEVVTIGLPNCLTISRTMLLSGTRIPTVFFFELNNLGTLVVALKINVKGPGNAFLRTRKTAVSKDLVYCEISVRS
ncbi:hypothetical protein D3C76_1532920 [compost metagenome]